MGYLSAFGHVSVLGEKQKCQVSDDNMQWYMSGTPGLMTRALGTRGWPGLVMQLAGICIIFLPGCTGFVKLCAGIC